MSGPLAQYECAFSTVLRKMLVCACVGVMTAPVHMYNCECVDVCLHMCTVHLHVCELCMYMSVCVCAHACLGVCACACACV